jgi:hypothetical protein
MAQSHKIGIDTAWQKSFHATILNHTPPTLKAFGGEA